MEEIQHVPLHNGGDAKIDLAQAVGHDALCQVPEAHEAELDPALQRLAAGPAGLLLRDGQRALYARLQAVEASSQSLLLLVS